MSIDTVKDSIRQKLAFAAGFNARVKFDFGDEGRIFVDTTQSPAVISDDNSDADVTLSCALATIEGILNGSQDPNIAFMMGKLKVSGSMGLAMKLNGLLGD